MHIHFRTSAIALLVFACINLHATDFRLQPSKFWRATIIALYYAGEYEAAANLAFDFFLYENNYGQILDPYLYSGLKDQPVYTSNGLINPNIKDFLPSSKKDYPILRGSSTIEEATIYFYGACSLAMMAEKEDESFAGRVFFFKDYEMHLSIVQNLAFLFMAYIFADLADSYYDNTLKDSDEMLIYIGRIKTKEEYCSLLRARRDCKAIKNYFDDLYYKSSLQYLPGEDYATKIILQKYVLLARNPKKSNLMLKKATQELEKYKKSNNM